MARPPLVLLPVLLLPGLAGCHNACQRICLRMADYAEECGITVPPEQVDACVAAQAGAASRGDRAVCRQAGDAATIREEWACEDLETYWARVASNPDTGGADTGP